MFLKLEFLKAYDMMEWDFLFGTMMEIGLLAAFNNFMALLFKDASASVKINRALSDSFSIERGVGQGYPLEVKAC